MKQHTPTYRLPKGIESQSGKVSGSSCQDLHSRKCRGQRNTLNCSMKVQFPDWGKGLGSSTETEQHPGWYA